MPFTYQKKRKNPPQKRTGSKGFPEGLNTLAHGSALKDTELSEFINGVYSQYGTVSKRLGTLLIGDPSTDGTKIMNMGAAYNIDGEDYLIRMSDNGKPEYRDFDTNTWEYLSGTEPVGYVGSSPTFASGIPTFNTTVITNIVQARGKIFFANELDQLVYFEDGAWFAYTAIANPTTKTTVAKTGTGTGTRSYFYRYVEYNEVGGTTISPAFAGGDVDGTGYKDTTPTLHTSIYLTITLPTAPAGTTRRALFRGDVAG